jgi:hypothetical protein
MKHFLLAILLLSCGVGSINAQQPAVAETPDSAGSSATTVADNLQQLLWQIAAGLDVPIGFESADEPINALVRNRLPPLSSGGGTLTDRLNDIVRADMGYEWRMVDGVIVVRPKRAWADPQDPLNRRVQDVLVTDMPSSAVLRGIHDFIYTNRFVVTRNNGTDNMPLHVGSGTDNVSLHVGSGIVLDVLNRLTLATGDRMWVVCSRILQGTRAGFHVGLRNAKSPTGFIGSTARPVPTWQ